MHLVSLPEEPASASALPARDDTLSERAALLVERDILSGTFQPGARLIVQSLSQHYGIGTTPLREGLSRLVTRRLITAIGQRGFRVAHVSRGDLEDITCVRILVEVEALRLSISDGGDTWEVGIVAALHHLRLALERAPEQMQEGTAAFDGLHKGFHRALIAGCRSERLLALHDDLYMQAYRYRRVMMSRLGPAEWFLREHQDLADIVISRQMDQAIARLSHHLRQTIVAVYDAPVEGATVDGNGTRS